MATGTNASDATGPLAVHRDRAGSSCVEVSVMSCSVGLRRVLAVGICLVIAGCGGSQGDGGEAQATTGSPTASATATAPSSWASLVAQDVQYASRDPEGPWDEHLMDFYAREGATGVPLVVIFHGGSLSKGGSAYPRLAEALVARGAVVASADWTDRAPAGLLDQGMALEDIVTRQQQTTDEVACAVDFAVSRAEQYGADPSKLVLVGHSAGANAASGVGLAPHNPFAGCAAPDAQWAPRGLMLWEGDWLAGDPSGDWDSFGDDLGATILQTVTPWGHMDDAPALAVELAVGDVDRRAMRRCDADEKVDWLAMRDPDGSIRGRLEALGATADGCIDVGEFADVLADAMVEHGIDATVLALPDPTTTHTHLAEADLTLMADHIMALAQG